jgi:methionyl-tRNA formyltransferase
MGGAGEKTWRIDACAGGLDTRAPAGEDHSMIRRIVLIATAPPAALTVDAALRRLGYDVVAILSLRVAPGRFGAYDPAWLLRAAPGGDVLFIASPATLGPLLGAYAPDVALCCSFPAQIPEAALAVPRYGIVNVHPGLLPRYPGPNPLGWALRNGDRELGLTVHRMTADIDGGPILAQGAVPVTDDDDSDAIIAKLGTLLELLPGALERLVAGDAGDPQPSDGGGYAGVFEREYVEVDWSRSAREIHRQTRAWSLAPPIDGRRGPCTELDGHRVRLVRTRLDADAGGVPVACGDGTLWVLETEPAVPS